MEQKRLTNRQTGPDDAGARGDSLPPQPGLIVVFSGGSPQWSLLTIPASSDVSAGADCYELELGRDNLGQLLGDGRISRRHTLVRYSRGGFSATDLGSLNGTSVDGVPSAPQCAIPLNRCLRIGDTLLLPVPDLHAFQSRAPTARDGLVIGSRLAQVYQRISRIAKSSLTLYITGESGSGKENAARSFHTASPVGRGPFVAVNCATIPEGIAERLLFGAKRGAFSGATADSDGYIQAAHNGTLFLDEVAELHATVQAKLLRVLESREVLPVGAVRPQAVNLRICSASHRSLQAEVAAGRLREDLYYRIGRPSERVPALRERAEDIPWLVDSELQKCSPGLSAHTSLIEACMLRPWPGNIRELLVEIRAAAQEAVASESPRVKTEHLAATAGQLIKAPSSAPEPPPTPSSPPAEQSSTAAPVVEVPAQAKPAAERPNRALIMATLLDAQCNVSEAARRLGMHRTELRRQMAHFEINIEHLRQLGS